LYCYSHVITCFLFVSATYILARDGQEGEFSSSWFYFVFANYYFTLWPFT